MKYMYAIKDEKTGAFHDPFFAAHTEHVVRSVRRTLSEKRPGDNYAEFPQDFSLWILGEFNHETGVIIENHQHIANLVAMKEMNTNA